MDAHTGSGPSRRCHRSGSRACYFRDGSGSDRVDRRRSRTWIHHMCCPRTVVPVPATQKLVSNVATPRQWELDLPLDIADTEGTHLVVAPVTWTAAAIQRRPPSSGGAFVAPFPDMST